MSEQPHERLAREMNTQRVFLRLRWAQVAERAGMDASNLRRIRRGEIEVTDFAAAQIEDAMQWSSGTVRDILQGGVPTPRPQRADVDELRDETEREIWAIGELSEEARWSYIDSRRQRLVNESRQDGRAVEHDGGQQKRGQNSA